MKTYDCDVVVIGAGISGMVAAVRAAQSGRKVLVLEKSPNEDYLCNSRLTQGVWHCALEDVLSAPEMLEARIMEATGNEARPDLARAIAHDGIRVVRWMQSIGVSFMKGPLSYQSFVLSPPSVSNDSGHQWRGRGGDVMLRTLESALKRYGGQLLRGFCGQTLVQDNRSITGVSGVTSDGTPFTVRSRAVVMADGGFQANTKLLEAYGVAKSEQVFQRNAHTGTGDCLLMAQEVGAVFNQVSSFYGHLLSRDAFTNEKLSPYPFLDFVMGSGILVDKHAQRFADEGVGGVAMANLIAQSDDPLDKIVIADDSIWRNAGTFRLLSPNPNLVNAGGTIHQANSIEELAQLCGLDPQKLMREVQRYNAAVRTGKTELLTPTRTTQGMKPQPIETGPFYAFPVCAGITYTMGGIAINANAQALTLSGEPIPGLYAVGCATGGLEGGKLHGYIGGLLKSSVTGLRAAEHIIGEVIETWNQSNPATASASNTSLTTSKELPSYRTLQLIVRYGELGVIVISCTLLFICLGSLLANLAPLMALPVILLGIAFLHLLMRSYVELVRVIVEMLLPK